MQTFSAFVWPSLAITKKSPFWKEIRWLTLLSISTLSWGHVTADRGWNLLEYARESEKGFTSLLAPFWVQQSRKRALAGMSSPTMVKDGSNRQVKAACIEMSLSRSLRNSWLLFFPFREWEKESLHYSFCRQSVNNSFCVLAATSSTSTVQGAIVSGGGSNNGTGRQTSQQPQQQQLHLLTVQPRDGNNASSEARRSMLLVQQQQVSFT